jgi:hypothetical protein
MFVRYADNLLHEGKLAWNPGGPPTYGLTSPLYLLVVMPIRLLIPGNAAQVMLVASIISGLLFMALLSVLILRYTETNPTTRLILLLGVFWLLAITLGHQADQLLAGAWTTFFLVDDLAAHFLSGMDTMFVLSYLTLYLILAKEHERRQSAGSAIMLGLLGGLAFAARPDLLLYTLAIPIFLFVLAPGSNARRKAFLALIITAAVLVLELGMATLYFDSPLPLPFFAKGVHGYGQAFAQVYAQSALIYLIAYFVSYWPLILPTTAALILAVIKRKRLKRPVEAALLAATIVFILYYLFFVLHIMGFSQRFYFPTLPAIIFLAVQSTSFLLAEIPEDTRAHFQSFSNALPRLYKVLAILFLLGTTLQLAPIAKDAVTRLAKGDFRFLRMNVEDNYTAYSLYRWFALDHFTTLPDSLVIATTEVGHPAVMNPDKRIIDLTGLNERDFAFDGFSAERLFNDYNPDLLYMPHPDYRDMIAQIEHSSDFENDYDYYSPEVLGGPYAMGVALRRDSPFYQELLEIIENQRQN